jgi:hypothetical protein
VVCALFKGNLLLIAVFSLLLFHEVQEPAGINLPMFCTAALSTVISVVNWMLRFLIWIKNSWKALGIDLI